MIKQLATKLKSASGNLFRRHSSTMYQAQIDTWGSAPKMVTVPDLPAPGPDQARIKVEAVGVHQVVRSRASGKHYSSGNLPHVPGIDGVGIRESDGKKVYFFTFAAGTMVEYLNMPNSSVYELPDEADPVQVAGSINPAMSSWMAFKGRTQNLPKDFNVLIIGATSASGRVAIPIARSLGAKKIIGAARSQSTLDTLGLDQTIIIDEDPTKTDFSNLDDVDVVLDYVYGPLAIHLFDSLNTPKPVQYVHIGALSQVQTIDVPGAILRSKDITIRGSGPGAWSMKDFAKTLPELLKDAASFPKQPVHTEQLKNVETGWNYSGPERLVFTRA